RGPAMRIYRLELLIKAIVKRELPAGLFPFLRWARRSDWAGRIGDFDRDRPLRMRAVIVRQIAPDLIFSARGGPAADQSARRRRQARRQFACNDISIWRATGATLELKG